MIFEIICTIFNANNQQRIISDCNLISSQLCLSKNYPNHKNFVFHLDSTVFFIFTKSPNCCELHTRQWLHLVLKNWFACQWSNIRSRNISTSFWQQRSFATSKTKQQYGQKQWWICLKSKVSFKWGLVKWWVVVEDFIPFGIWKRGLIFNALN